MNPRFTAHDETTAPERARPLLTAQREKFGFVASPLARLAESPGMLAAALRALSEFDETSLSPAEREVVAFTVGYENGCGYCMALHSALARRVPGIAPHVAALREGRRPDDARLGAMSDFVRAMIRRSGAVSDAEWNAFTSAGYSAENALDVVLGIGTYTLTTFANRLVQAPVDAAFEEHRWAPPT